MTKPLFASKWYKDTPPAEVRREVQNLYERLTDAKATADTQIASVEKDLKELLESLGEDVTALESGVSDLESDKVDRAGDTMTGDLTVNGMVTLEDDTESSLHLNVAEERVGSLSGTSVGNLVLASDKSGGNIYLRPNGRDSPTGELFWGAASSTPQFRDGEGNEQGLWHEGNLPLSIHSWTPTLHASVSNPAVTYSTQVGFYIRIAPRLVWVYLRLATSSRTGGSGHITIEGFPFQLTNLGSNTSGILSVEASQIDHGSGARSLSVRASPAGDVFIFISSPSNGSYTAVDISGWKSSGNVAMSGLVVTVP